MEFLSRTRMASTSKIAALKGEFITGHETAAWLKLEISGEFEETKELVDFCRSLEDATNRARYSSRQKN